MISQCCSTCLSPFCTWGQFQQKLDKHPKYSCRCNFLNLEIWILYVKRTSILWINKNTTKTITINKKTENLVLFSSSKFQCAQYEINPIWKYQNKKKQWLKTRKHNVYVQKKRKKENSKNNTNERKKQKTFSKTIKKKKLIFLFFF